MAKKSETRLQQFITEAKRLHARAAEGECDFFHFLMEGEKDKTIWHGDPKAHTGFSTFAELLSSTPGFPRPHRFERFKEAVIRFGWDKVRKAGLEGAREACVIPHDAMSNASKTSKAGDAVIGEYVAFESRNGTPVSRQQARNIRKIHFPPTPKKKETPVYADELAEVKAKYAVAQKTIAKLEREKASLQAKLEKAEAALTAIRERGGDSKKPGTARDKRKH